jgi:hypothetical protein
MSPGASGPASTAAASSPHAASTAHKIAKRMTQVDRMNAIRVHHNAS